MVLSCDLTLNSLDLFNAIWIEPLELEHGYTMQSDVRSWLQTMTSVLLVCVLSSLLYIVMLEVVVALADTGDSWMILTRSRITNLRLTDDLVIMADGLGEPENHWVSRLHGARSRFRLMITISKTNTRMYLETEAEIGDQSWRKRTWPSWIIHPHGRYDFQIYRDVQTAGYRCNHVIFKCPCTVLRRIRGISLRDRWRNDDIKAWLGIECGQQY